MHRGPVAVEEQLLQRAIKEECPWENLPKRLQVTLSSKEEWHRRIIEYCIRKRLQWNNCFARKVCKESEYYEEMMRYLRKNLALFPYHLAEYICRIMRISPFKYYCDIIFEVMKNEQPYDSIPNFSAADALRLTGIGRNEFIDIMNKCRSKKIMWKLNKSIARELLPTQPVDFPIEPWWGICLVNFTLEEFKKLSEEEAATIDKICKEEANSSILFDPDIVKGLYRRGLIYFDVPVYPDDRFKGTSQPVESVWRHLWRWKIPEKIKTFMWLFCHNRIHTAQLRASRGLQPDESCPFGCNQVENAMHLLRECVNAKERWKCVIKPLMWESFYSKQGVEWVTWNLTKEAGADHTKKIPWATLFGYICWDIWVDRCNRLFNTTSTNSPSNGMSTFFRACLDQDLLEKCQFYNLNGINERQSNRDVGREVRLEVDGSVLQDGRSGCGGVIRDGAGNWICGFSCKLTNVPPTIAEVIGIIHGLNMCWNRNYREVSLLSDSLEAINLVTRGCDDQHPFEDVIDDARIIVNQNWKVLLYHVYREENHLADYLANLSHSLDTSFRILDQPPPFYQEVEGDVGG